MFRRGTSTEVFRKEEQVCRDDGSEQDFGVEHRVEAD